MTNMCLSEPFPLPLPPARLAEILGSSPPLALSLVRLAGLQSALAAGDPAPMRHLAPSELARYESYHFAKRRLEWLGGRLAAKQSAATLCPGSSPKSWVVGNRVDGQPFLQPVAGYAAPTLSISHSHGLAAALAVSGQPCGFDLQQNTDTVVRVREKYCRETEAGLLHRGGLAAEPVTESLTMLWAAKEALRKGLGGHPLTGFLAMELARIQEVADRAWLFTLKIKTARDAEHPVLVWWLGDFAAALTVINL